MNKIKTFLYVFVKSISSVKYYEEIVKTNTAFTMKYFFVLALLASLIATAGILVPNLSTINKEVKGGLEQAKSIYPATLAVTVKGGKLSINQPEPYFITTPKSFIENTPEIPTNFIVFDSKGTIDDVTKYNTLILVNQTNVLIKTNGKIEANPIGEMPDGTLTKANIDTFLTVLEGYSKYVPYLLAIFIFIAMVLYYGIFRIFYLLIVGTVLWTIGKARGMGFGYDKYFKIAVHTFTLPLVLDLIIKIGRVNLMVPFWFFLINVIFGLIIILSLHKTQKEAN
jgi:hypothetical protein